MCFFSILFWEGGGVRVLSEDFPQPPPNPQHTPKPTPEPTGTHRSERLDLFVGGKGLRSCGMGFGLRSEMQSHRQGMVFLVYPAPSSL